MRSSLFQKLAHEISIHLGNVILASSFRPADHSSAILPLLDGENGLYRSVITLSKSEVMRDERFEGNDLTARRKIQKEKRELIIEGRREGVAEGERERDRRYGL